MLRKTMLLGQPTTRAHLLLLETIITRELSVPPGYAINNSPNPSCPHCRSKRTAKRGHDAYGRQRYMCKSCLRSFTESTGKTLSSTNLSLETWLVFAECHIGQLSLRESAQKCDVSLKTAFYMRKRIVAIVHLYSRQVKAALSACAPRQS